MEGKVRWYSNQGYGFIDAAGHAGRDAVYFHLSAVRNQIILRTGDSVTFETVQGPKGLKAVDVRRS